MFSLFHICNNEIFASFGKEGITASIQNPKSRPCSGVKLKKWPGGKFAAGLHVYFFRFRRTTAAPRPAAAAVRMVRDRPSMIWSPVLGFHLPVPCQRA